MLLLCVILGGGIVAGTKWYMNTFSVTTMVVNTQDSAPEGGNSVPESGDSAPEGGEPVPEGGDSVTIMVENTFGFAPLIGNLTLTARAVSDDEVVLNLTFNALHRQPSWKFRVDIRKGPTSPGLEVGVLPEGLELVSGDLVWEGYNNVERVSIEAKARAVMDGEWGVCGWAVRVEGTWDNYGALDAVGSGALTIIVSNGTITDITRAQPPPPDITPPGEQGVRLYYLTVISPYGTPGGEGLYEYRTTAYATLDTSIIDYGNGTRRVFTHWSGDASGTNYTQSDPIYMNYTKTAIANWKTQYYLTLGTNPSNITTPTGQGWYDAGTFANISAPAFVDIVSGTSRYRFLNWTTADMTEITNKISPSTTVLMDKPKTVTANYVTEYI